jgi:hypothetical protein
MQSDKNRRSFSYAITVKNSCFFDCSVALCQVKLLITNNAFCIVQRATAQLKTGVFRDYGVAEAPPGFQADWSDVMYFFLSLSVHSVCSFGVFE